MNTPALQIVRALRGQWNGRSGMARCPAHVDRVPSLSVSDEGRKVLVHCHAGCDQKSVISALYRLGLWPTANPPTGDHAEATTGHQHEAIVTDQSKRDCAVRTWLATSPAEGTLAERYLIHRGITARVPASLRFAPRLFHAPTGQYLPAVMAAIHTAGGATSAIQRVFLRTDGLGKAEVTPAKMSLWFPGRWRCSPCSGWRGYRSMRGVGNRPIRDATL